MIRNTSDYPPGAGRLPALTRRRAQIRTLPPARAAQPAPARGRLIRARPGRSIGLTIVDLGAPVKPGTTTRGRRCVAPEPSPGGPREPIVRFTVQKRAPASPI